MKNLLNKIIIKRHHLFVNEEDVTRVLALINKHNDNLYLINLNEQVGNCGWADKPGMWYIHFSTTNEKWERIRRELKVRRVWKSTGIPAESIGKIYSTD